MILLIEDLRMKRFISASNPKQFAVSSPLIVMHLCVLSASVFCFFFFCLCVWIYLWLALCCNDSPLNILQKDTCPMSLKCPEVPLRFNKPASHHATLHSAEKGQRIAASFLLRLPRAVPAPNVLEWCRQRVDTVDVPRQTLPLMERKNQGYIF